MEQTISISGNEKSTISTLTKYMSTTSVEVFLANLHKYKNLFEPDEYYSINHIKDESSADIKHFMVNNSNYYINLKATTVALVCLLLDIKITNGFASFLFAATGLNFALVKLAKIEKCVLIRAKKLKTKRFTIASVENSIYSTDMCVLCEYFANNKCCIDPNYLQQLLDSLVDKKILSLRDQSYTYMI